MFCRTCDYPLWNLKTNRCPECGDEFDWRDYRFKPDSVSLGCPNCGHTRTDLQSLAQLTAVNCEACGQTVAVQAMTVAPLTDDPWDAAALPDYPAPPFRLFSAGYWWLVLMVLIELPGVAVAFMPFAWGVTPWGAILDGHSISFLIITPFLAGMLVTAGSIRSLLPWRWTRVELVGAWLAVAALLGLPLIAAVVSAGGALAEGQQLGPVDYVVLFVPPCLLVALVLSIVIQWRWRVPHVYVTQMSFRAVFMSGPLICLLTFGVDEIGSAVTLYLVIVYGIVLVLGHLLMWRLARRRRLYLPRDARARRARAS